MKIRAGIGDDSEWRIGSPTAFGSTAGNKQTHQHNDAADDKRPITGGVHFSERHVGRTDMDRVDKMSEGGEGERHYLENEHDRRLHGPSTMVVLPRPYTVRSRPC